MVSERKALGKPHVILVTVGSTSFNFDRVFNSVEKTLKKIKSNATLIVQKGHSKYEWSYTKIRKYTFIKPTEFIDIIKQADKIITHAGPGTLFYISEYTNKQPFIVPRLAEFNEHVDNHQKFFANFLATKLPKLLKNYVYLDGNLDDRIQMYLEGNDKKNMLSKYIFTGKKGLCLQLNNYIKNI